MKRIFLFAMMLGLAAACSGKAAEPQQPVVYMTTEISPESLVRIYEALGRPAEGRVAVKISTGEPGGHNFLQPSLIKDLVQKVDGTIVECNTAYGGRRSSTEEHLKAAREHGFFDIADVDIMDSEGEFTIPVRDTTHIKYDIVGTHLQNYDFMINLAHFKGHAMAGFGGVISQCRSHRRRRTDVAEHQGRYAGRLPRVHGRRGSGRGRLLRREYPLYKCDEQPLGRL